VHPGETLSGAQGNSCGAPVRRTPTSAAAKSRFAPWSALSQRDPRAHGRRAWRVVRLQTQPFHGWYWRRRV